MQIGIDGGALSVTDDRLKVGTYRVAYNLVKELPRIDVKSSYRVYSFGRGGDTHNNVECIRLPRTGFSLIWQPVELIRNPVDAYLGISQSLPFTLYDVNKIGFIYDVGFLEHPEYYRESYFSLQRQTASVVKSASHIVTISNASAASIQKQYGVPNKKLTVSYLGVEPGFTKHGNHYRSPRPYFLYVGALKPGKNVPMMLRAFAQFLKTTDVLCDFIITGSDYWLDPDIPSTIAALGIRERVQITGFVDDETLARYYRGAVALVNVSRIEGFGLPTVEAMACGCPVIGSTAGSMPEVISQSGILVNPDDETQLVIVMQHMMKKNIRSQCISKGITRAKEFTWRSFAKTIYELYRHRSG